MVVRLLRRVLAALVMALIAAGGIRTRGRGGTPPQHGGWQPVAIDPTAPGVPASSVADDVAT